MEHVTVHDGHSYGSTHLDPTSASSPTGRHRQGGDQGPQHTRARFFAGVAVVALVAAAVMASIAWATDATLARRTDTFDSVPTVATDAAEWIQSTLPRDATFLTNGFAAPSGHPGASIDGPDQDWHDFDYLLTAPGTDPPLDAAVAVVWQSSIPVAVFPTMQVRHILEGPLAETLRTREADRADRLIAGTALLNNPWITASAQAQQRLAGGGLDLRGAATLTALAGSMPVNLVDIEDVKPEALAGMPARAMTIHVVDVLKGSLAISGMAAAFRPDQVIATPDGTFRLHWPLRLAPLPSVN